MSLDTGTLADEMMTARSSRHLVSILPSARDVDFDVAAAYRVEAELTRRRRAAGRTTVGLKVGYANRAMWRVLKIETLVWAHMYDDTVRYAHGPEASLAIGRMISPRIEPEIVFAMKSTPAPEQGSPADVLANVEWMAFGFEVVDSLFVDAKHQPADFVAAYGFHAALIVGEPRRIEPADVPELVDRLARFEVKLLKNGELAAEGSGRNVLKSPLLCLGELASAISRQPLAEELAPGDIVTSGSLTESRALAVGETWRADLEGLELPSLTLHTTT